MTVKEYQCIEANLDGKFLNMKIKAGRLDASSISRFKEDCEVFLKNTVEELNIDMSEVEFVDSSAVGTILGFYKRLSEKKAIVRLLKLQPQVKDIIELLRLHRVFEIQD
jgi:anti-anti-sigma factor